MIFYVVKLVDVCECELYLLLHLQIYADEKAPKLVQLDLYME